MKIKNIFYMVFLMICSSYDLFSVYIIRDATLDDKGRILALYRKCNKWYQDGSVDSSFISKQVVVSKLYASLDHGFALVVEDLSDENPGGVLAFLLKNRPMGKAYCHIIDCSLSSVDPEFRSEKLMEKLYMHLLDEIKAYHSDILRVEAICPVSFAQSIAMYEQLGFIKECIRLKCVRRLDGGFDDEQLLVWWNPNFDSAVGR